MRARSIVLLCLVLVAVVWSDTLDESLLVRPLQDGGMLARVRMVVESPEMESSHYHLLPKSLGDIVDRYGVVELHWSLGAGRWYADRWGMSPSAAPEGLWFTARFEGQESHEKRWRGLCESLGALLGVSMGFLKDANSVILSDGSFVGSLPNELLCTENLTPFLQLLPCRDRAGLGLLLDPVKIFSSAHHALVLSFSRLKSMRMTADVVLVISRPVTLWTSQAIFGQADFSRCALSDTSYVEVDLSLTPQATGLSAGRYSIPLPSPFALRLALSKEERKNEKTSSLVATRFLTGTGLERGSMKLVIETHSQHVKFEYLEMVPWYFRVERNSIKFSMNGLSHPLPSEQAFQAGVERHGPSVFHFEFSAKSNTTLELSYSFTKAFLHLSEYPPDAHLGFFFPAARLRSTAELVAETLFTDVQVAQTALPDFSMPFNVVTLSGILLGYFFGAILGLATTRYAVLKRGLPMQSQRPMARFLRKVLAVIDGPLPEPVEREKIE